MHFSLPIWVVASTVCATGFTLPEGQADGVYQVHYDANNTAVFTWLRGPVNQAPDPGKLRSVHARDYDTVECGGYTLISDDTNKAVEALKAQCNPGAVTSGRDFYSISGTSVAYVCDFGDSAIVCQEFQLTNSFAKITGACGSYTAGWETFQTEAYWYSIGYEYNETNFCGRGPTDHSNDIPHSESDGLWRGDRRTKVDMRKVLAQLVGGGSKALIGKGRW
ncbi:hypothetical protein F5Y16DRAFT_415941 [Xylariaceae sp. FL0255]|nr:hypothetical protein F5Y16DRAFT_415941 [Xylariaceae sp. FL0255]